MIKVFYDARQSVANNESFSPSAGKPALVVEEWKKKGYDFSLASVSPLTREDIKEAHDPSYVDRVLDLKIENGFGNKNPAVAPALLWTTGSFSTAAAWAYTFKENTMSPTSGFHHAEFYRGGGFCTFNGLAIAAIRLKKQFPDIKIGIIDIDHHYGNGTDNIIKKLKLDYIKHYTFGADYTNYDWRGGQKAETWLRFLPNVVTSFKDCSIIFYQAGADPHVEDPFGGALTTAQLRKRDEIVFGELKALKIPVCWNLAGGYQEPIQKVLDIHNATMEECLKVM